MARTIKIGLDYFPFDVDLFQDIRIRKLIKYQSGKAITVYALLLCTIYKNGYYIKWDKELPFIISEQSGYTEAYIQEVIDCCMNIGLLSKDLFESEGVLTSKGIQERYRKICSSLRRNCAITDYNLLPTTDDTITPVNKPKSKDTKPSKSSPGVAPHASAGLSKVKNPPSPQHSPAPTPYTATLEEEVAEMLSNVQWKESVCIRYSLSIDQIDFYLKDFALKCKKERHTSLQDAKSNFCYWLQKQKLKQTIKQNIQAQSKDNYTYNGGFGGEDV